MESPTNNFKYSFPEDGTLLKSNFSFQIKEKKSKKREQNYERSVRLLIKKISFGGGGILFVFFFNFLVSSECILNRSQQFPLLMCNLIGEKDAIKIKNYYLKIKFK